MCVLTFLLRQHVSKFSLPPPNYTHLPFHPKVAVLSLGFPVCLECGKRFTLYLAQGKS